MDSSRDARETAAAAAAVEKKYADIIHMDRPGEEVVCGKHPRMSNADRAKIFAPFAALRGHSERLSVEVGKLLRQNRIEFSEEEAQILSDKLYQVEKGMEVGIVYFIPDSPSSSQGYYTKLEGKVIAVDSTFRTIRIDNTTVHFNDLADVYGEDIIYPDYDDSI